MKLVAAVAIPILTLLAQPADRASSVIISAVRHWVSGDTLRIAIEGSGDFDVRGDRLHNPERVYYDIAKSRPSFGTKQAYLEDLDSPLVKRIRVAETVPGVTRVVLDLNGPVQLTVTHLRSPSRLVLEVRPSGTAAPVTAPPAAAPAAPPATAAPPVRQFTPPDPKAPKTVPGPALTPSPVVRASAPAFDPLKVNQPRPDPPKADPPKPDPAPVVAESTKLNPETGPAATEDAKPARRTSAGTASLTRALGLKLNRVVIDPGHGGHDQGTAGPHGLIEKELVLDVSLRLGKLIEDQLGAEVIYTRADDTFVGLERRTQIANEKKADLFLSVHANSSAYPAISGVETYVLNFTDSRSALDVAMRENAGAQTPMSDLHDIIQKITAQDKTQESKELAGRVQAALYAFSARNFPGELNRGVKQAPFIVLIGSSMPAILTEIGFVTSAKEESLLKKPDYRQKLAESIYSGVARYADGLSHFQLAQAPSGN